MSRKTQSEQPKKTSRRVERSFMHTRSEHSPNRSICAGRIIRTLVAMLILAFSAGLTGCDIGPQGEGPGHRDQPLALSPDQELKVGREAYQQILEKAQVVQRGADVERVRRVSRKIAEVAQNEPLQREINLRLSDYTFEWEYNVVKNDQVNAFCLPGGKIVVFTGLLRIVQNDDQLAAVVAHEVAHALAHHSSERIARERVVGRGLRALSYNRSQETEADHIGIFLMTFAGYDPQEAVSLWREMQNVSRDQIHLPELLSDHPNDARRMEQLQEWVIPARAAKKAFDEGRVLPAAQRR
jgi:predicted Zn-dependent protease